MVGLAGSSSLLLFARSGAGSNPYNPSDPNAKNPLPTSCSSPDFPALDNAKGQDPCQVAWDLLPGPCFDPKAITPGELPPLNQLGNNQCLCNTVFFSLVYVCELCTTMQRWAPSWGVYSSALQCTTKPINGFLDYNEPDIPPHTAIPSWAYQPLDDDGTVDLQQATSLPVAPIQSQSSPPPPGPDSIAGSFSPTTTSTPPPSTTFSSGTDSTSESLHWSSALSSRDITHTILQGGASSIITAPSGAQTAVATTSRRASSLRRPAFIGASVGLSAAAFVTIIAVVLLFRRDRRLTRGAKLAQLSQPRNVNLFGYASPGGLPQSGIAGADDLPGCGARDPALEPLRPQRLVRDAGGIRAHKATAHRPTLGICEGGVWRA